MIKSLKTCRLISQPPLRNVRIVSSGYAKDCITRENLNSTIAPRGIRSMWASDLGHARIGMGEHTIGVVQPNPCGKLPHSNLFVSPPLVGVSAKALGRVS